MTARMQATPSASDAIRSFAGEIVTPRLLLRVATLADAEPMFAIFNDWEIVRWLARPIWPQEFSVYRDSLRHADAERLSGQSLYLAIEVDGQIVGGAAWTVADGLINLGYWIGQRHWGRGFVTEAAGAMCDWIFAETREPAIYSGVFEGNAASMRVQHKLGFIQIGTSVHYSTPRGQDLVHLDTKLTRTARRVALEKANR
jgi:RimJ/RimL family protein N-acetyltransferase